MTRGFILVWLVLISFRTAGAQTPTGNAAAQGYPLKGRLDFSTSLSMRGGSSSGQGLGLRFGGVSPAHLRLSGALFSEVSRYGGFADAQYEWFTLEGQNLLQQTQRLGLKGFKLSAGAVARYRPSPALSLEAQLGYGFEQLPMAEGSSGVMRDVSLRYHGPVLGAVAEFDTRSRFGFGFRTRLMPVSFSSRVFPISLGAHLTYGGLHLGRMRLHAMLDYEVQASWAREPTVTASQFAYRLGLGFRLALPDSRAVDLPTGPGLIRGRAFYAESQEPAVGASIQVGRMKAVSTDGEGAFRVEEVPPGAVKVRASLPGRKALTREVSLSPEEEVQLTFPLEKSTGPGVIRGKVFASDGKTPLPNIAVETAAGISVQTGADGAFTLEPAGPGPVPVKVSAVGFQTSEEVVSVPAEGEATLEVSLEKAGAKVLASLKGRVRTLSGKSVSGRLSIPEAKIVTKTDKQGRFHVRVPGGRYTVHFEAVGFHKQTQVVEVADGDQTIFYIDLTPLE